MNRGEVNRALTAEKKAYELRDRLTGQLKYLAETLYFNVGLGDLEQSYPIYEEWVRTFPLDGVAHFNFAGCPLSLGRYDEAAAEVREAVRLTPLLGSGSYDTLMNSTISAGHLEEAKVVYAQAVTHKADSPYLRQHLFIIAFLQQDSSAMEAQFRQALAQNNTGVFLVEAAAKVYGGRFSKAHPLLEQGIISAGKNAPAGWMDRILSF